MVEVEDEVKSMHRRMLELEEINERQSKEIEYIINEKKFSNREEIEELQKKYAIKDKSFNNKEKEWLRIKHDYNRKIEMLNEGLKAKSR